MSTLDSSGFPFARAALRRCPKCHQMRSRANWRHDDAHGVYCCAFCSTAVYDYVLGEIRKRIEAARTRKRREQLEALARDAARKRRQCA